MMATSLRYTKVVMHRKVLIFSALFICAAATTTVDAAARSLSLGLSGNDVQALQTQLIAKGYLEAGKATGYFGPLTDAAVKKFQCDQSIICSGDSISGYGIAGPRTQAALGITSGVSSILSASPQPSAITGSLTPKATGAFEVSGWVPDWRAASGTLDVTPHLSQLKSVMPFGYSVSGSGKLIDHAHITQEPWPSFIASAKAQGVRVVPTVFWGDGEATHRILSNTTTRIALEDEIAAMVKQNGFDGIDIDFEAKQHETINYFSTFLKGLYQRMGNKWVYCTIESRMPLEDRYSPGATIPPDATDYANDYREMNKYCDRIEIMAYDQGTVSVRLNAARSAPYAPVADPGWVENVVTLAAQTISRNKIIVGIPNYGYEYEVTPLAGSGFEYVRQWAFNPGYATQIAAQLGITPHRTSANELGFVYNSSALQTVAPTSSQSTQTPQSTTASTTVAQNLPSTGSGQAASQVNTSQPFNYITWSDPIAMQDKVLLAKQLGVRGVAVFSLGGAADQAMWGILK
ncbi:MAG: glycosyl hydrolase family 18 protein [bacterium]|nr:glycosyl hydrolase family 18 protein [bacterium]